MKMHGPKIKYLRLLLFVVSVFRVCPFIVVPYMCLSVVLFVVAGP